MFVCVVVVDAVPNRLIVTARKRCATCEMGIEEGVVVGVDERRDG